ncbi:threonine--tRNA ligase [Candidatus Woesearchaeota archaeon]|nr:threonine--tRNA ligase [Candidatus Woesearchaeota archaeon]
MSNPHKQHASAAEAKITIEFPDSTKKGYPSGVSVQYIIDNDLKRFKSDALVAKLDDKLVDVFVPLRKGGKLKILTFNDKEGKAVFWHSSSHLLAQAVVELFPGAKLTIGPAVEDGFYYDIDHEPFTQEDMEKIEKRMREIAAKDYMVERLELSKKEAMRLFGTNEYKLELIDEMQDGEISAYQQGNFIDLCRGPHIASTGLIKAVKLTKIAGAYWRGNVKNKQLQRIYGISFPGQKMMDEHLKMLAEAERRDHRKLGKELEWFTFMEESPGAPFFFPKGTVIYNQLLAFIREEYKKRGYQEVITPLMYDKSIWITSGHWEHYRENMFTLKVEGKDFGLKSMNCPSHLLIYKSKSRSYKDLPLRIADFAVLHRNELSGVLGGLTRVRKFIQDDAHIFLAAEMIDDEMNKVFDFLNFIYKDTFNFELSVELSTRPENFMGKIDTWNAAEDTLKKALENKAIKFNINPGEGAFYGPKIDIHVKDALGRNWQLGTIQLDFQQPERFDATYIGQDGQKHRVVMIHRALLGSLERFIGILVEHYAGKLPLWLNPVQVKILTVADRFNEFAQKVKEQYEAAGIRAELDDKSESISYKVRQAELEKVNYVLVIGEKEVNSNTVTVRWRDSANPRETSVMSPDEFMGKALDEIKARK